MALTHHPDQEFVAGDDWTIAGVLLDINGNTLDLTSAELKWSFIDPNGVEVADVIKEAVISKTEPNSLGQLTIFVPATSTQLLTAGRYHDALRVTVGRQSTYWLGAILVDCDPFALSPPD